MTTDSYVERATLRVLRVRADMKGGGPAEAMRKLESKLATLRGRRFYGTFRVLPGGEEYFACVEKSDLDDPVSLQLEEAGIPGGLYVRRKLFDWSKVIAEGKLPSVFRDMVRHYDVDQTRPELEYYRSMQELHLLVPVQSRGPNPLDWVGADP